MVIKERLAKLSMCYSITVMDINGRPTCLCASEEREGLIAMVDTASKQETVLKGLGGGVMAMIPVPEIPNSFLAIRKFFPVFDSKEAEIVLCRVPDSFEGGETEAEVTLVARVPYVHRIALAGIPGQRRIIVSTLCEDKDFIEDWSRPGATFSYAVDGDFEVTGIKEIIGGIFKNHGMYTYEKRGGAYVLVSGDGGVWAIDANDNAVKICGEPVSDLCMFDVDGDGVDEMICIAPFHGDEFRVMKNVNGRWEILAAADISFGHALWCGKCGDETLLISCSRGGDKSIKLYRLTESDEGWALEEAVADSGVGTSNIYVEPDGDGICLYASNHGAGEVARYRINGL